MDIVDLFLYHAIYGDTPVGAYRRTRCAPYTLIRVRFVRKMVTAIIYFLGLQCQNISRACRDT